MRRTKAIIAVTITMSDCFLPRIEDTQQCTGLVEADAILDRCFDSGARRVLLKFGKDGVIVASPDARTHLHGRKVDTMDATGAGDRFVGALIAQVVAEEHLRAEARYANVAAALTTTGYGAVAFIPTAEQVVALLQSPAQVE
jgi:2-dehydro-3-deoxygluconokinase